MTPELTQELLPVTQADREAAQSILWVETLIDDVESIEQAFAKHRLAHQPQPVDVKKLFNAIRHGDDEHRSWLRDALETFFEDRPVPPVRQSAISAISAMQGAGGEDEG